MPISLSSGCAALFMGSCSGHGTGSGSTHHAGLGGGILPGCVKPPKDPKVVPKSVKLMDAVTMWPPCPQTSLESLTRNVRITIGTRGGREAAEGHARKLFATVKTVFINSKRAGVFGDPFGDGSVAFPCNSVVTGCSKNVFIGTTRG